MTGTGLNRFHFICALVLPFYFCRSRNMNTKKKAVSLSGLRGCVWAERDATHFRTHNMRHNTTEEGVGISLVESSIVTLVHDLFDSLSQQDERHSISYSKPYSTSFSDQEKLLSCAVQEQHSSDTTRHIKRRYTTFPSQSRLFGE